MDENLTAAQTGADQLSALQKRISELETENRTLKEQIDVYRDYGYRARRDRRDLFFAHLLGSGYYRTRAALEEEGRIFDIEFPNPDFAVVSVRPEFVAPNEGAKAFSRDEVNYMLANSLENCFQYPCYTADIQNHMIGILNLPACDGIPEKLLSQLEGAITVLDHEYDFRLRAVVSRVYHDPMELNHAMEDVQLLDEYLDVMGQERSVTAYEQLRHPHMEPPSFSFLEFETKLLGCARTSDIGGLRTLMHEMLNETIYIKPPSVDTFKFRMYGIINTMLYLMDDIRNVIGHEFFDTEDPGPQLTHAETMEDLMMTLDDVLIKLENYVSGNQNTIAPAWGEQIRDYVLAHYHDPNLTVASLADALNITPTYCSRMFRQATNQRLFDYIQLQRLSAAKELLSGDMSLTAIAESCGFSSALTMSRAFKRYEGAAPSLLREHLQPN